MLFLYRFGENEDRMVVTAFQSIVIVSERYILSFPPCPPKIQQQPTTYKYTKMSKNVVLGGRYYLHSVPLSRVFLNVRGVVLGSPDKTGDSLCAQRTAHKGWDEFGRIGEGPNGSHLLVHLPAFSSGLRKRFRTLEVYKSQIRSKPWKVIVFRRLELESGAFLSPTLFVLSPLERKKGIAPESIQRLLQCSPELALAGNLPTLSSSLSETRWILWGDPAVWGRCWRSLVTDPQIPVTESDLSGADDVLKAWPNGASMGSIGLVKTSASTASSGAWCVCVCSTRIQSNGGVCCVFFVFK